MGSSPSAREGRRVPRCQYLIDKARRKVKKNLNGRNEAGELWKKVLEQLERGEREVTCEPADCDVCHRCPFRPSDPSEFRPLPGSGTVKAPRSEREQAYPLSKPVPAHHSVSVSSKPTDITAPPKIVRIEVRDSDLCQGTLRISKGLEEMIRHYRWVDEVALITYGRYPVCVRIDTSSHTIRGDELSEWYCENQVRVGEIVYVEAPISPSESPRIFTAHEQSLYRSRSTGGGQRRRYLRHHVRRTLSQAGSCLHVQHIVEAVGKATEGPVGVRDIRPVLRHNSHLFRQFTGSLWGLAEWFNVESRPGVDPNSLLLAISEDDLVRTTIRQAGEPLNTKDICRRIAGYFGIPTHEVTELTPIDPNTQGLLKLTDGRWCLKTWVVEWESELAELQKQLNLLSMAPADTGGSDVLAKRSLAPDVVTPTRPPWTRLQHLLLRVVVIAARWVAYVIARMRRCVLRAERQAEAARQPSARQEPNSKQPDSAIHADLQERVEHLSELLALVPLEYKEGRSYGTTEGVSHRT